MRVVVTGAASGFGRAVVDEARARGHDVVASDRRDSAAGLRIHPCELSHPGGADDPLASWPEDHGVLTTDELLQGADRVIHLEPFLVRQGEWLDDATRCTYNLLGSAVASGVGRVVLVSSMEVLAGVPEVLTVQESYAPRPTATPEGLAPHLAEFTAREFARCTDLGVAIVRLGALAEQGGQPPDGARWWQSLAEAAGAVVDELQREDEADGMGQLRPDQFGRFEVRNLMRPFRYTVTHAATHQRPLTFTGEHKPRGQENAWPPADRRAVRRVLLLGAGGQLGPSTASALLEQPAFDVQVTDIVGSPDRRDPDQAQRSTDTPSPATAYEVAELDATDEQAVEAAARGVDAVVNCAVLRHHPRMSFEVNTRGTYNAVRAAAMAGHTRFVNTGPIHAFRHNGRSMSTPGIDFGMTEDAPLRPGLGLYAFTKALGAEICRVYAANHPRLHVMSCLFANFHEPEPPPGSEGMGASLVDITFEDGGRAIRSCLEVELERLPSNLEDFWMMPPNLPHGVYVPGKATRLLGWKPRHTLEAYTHRPSRL